MGVDEEQASGHRHRLPGAGRIASGHDHRCPRAHLGEPDPFPRQEAATRRFRLGLPRAFHIAPDGERAAFIRSAGGRDPVGSLWVAEPDRTGGIVERLVVDANAMLRADGEIPADERARRERLRETTTGITAFSTDSGVTRATFSLAGVPYCVTLTGPSDAVQLAHPGPVVDPRMSPDGVHVAYVSDGSLHLSPSDGTGPAVRLCERGSADESWGLADFVAAEELDRVRGLWWLPGSDALLVEHVDESGVPVAWIADPARPSLEPRSHRYPFAGAANPVARLYRVALDGTRVEVEWDHDAYPYLATVSVDPRNGVLVSVLSRDQRRQAVLGLPSSGSASSVVGHRAGEPWITVFPGVPALAPDGRLLEIAAVSDCFRLLVDGEALTPDGLNVTGVLDVSPERIVVAGSMNPFDRHVLAVDWSGGTTQLTSGPGVSSAAVVARGLVVATAVPERAGVRFEARLAGGTGPIVSLAEEPAVRPLVSFLRVTDRELATAVLWPAGHEPGSCSLPVVMAPYGGPHHARVVHSAGSFAPDQWLADQGFAVVVVDGSGTPGRGPAFEYEVQHDLAGRVLADQVDALHALGTLHPDLDLSRVGITGWSFGGYLAALAVLDRPDVFHAAVAGAPVADWRLYDTAYSERYLGLPAENPSAYDATSLLTRADRLERPLLLIHGLADDNVLAANTLQFSSALLAAGRAHSVLPLSGVTHMTPQEGVAENLLRLQAAFLAEHLQNR